MSTEYSGMPGRGEAVSDIEILRVFMVHDDPVLTATEVADNVSITRQACDNRLKQLADEGLLKTKSTGRDRVYWITPHGQETVLQQIGDL
jgi:predicted transcriptional regulator